MSLQTRSSDMFSLGVKTETLLESKNLRFQIISDFSLNMPVWLKLG